MTKSYYIVYMQISLATDALLTNAWRKVINADHSSSET